MARWRVPHGCSPSSACVACECIRVCGCCLSSERHTVVQTYECALSSARQTLHQGDVAKQWWMCVCSLLCFDWTPRSKTGGARKPTHFMTVEMENCSLRCNEEIQGQKTADRRDAVDLTTIFRSVTDTRFQSAATFPVTSYLAKLSSASVFLIATEWVESSNQTCFVRVFSSFCLNYHFITYFFLVEKE